MNRLHQPISFHQFAVNAVLGLFAVCILFAMWHIATLDEERSRVQDALDARAAKETKLQRAARAVCNDHPQRAGRSVEARWSTDGQLECLVVVAQEGGAR